MKRLILALVTVTTFATTVTTATPATAATKHRTPYFHCHYKGPDGRWTDFEVKQTIRCAASHWGVSTAKALYVANRESGYTPTAVNPYSGTSGIFQHMMRYWPGRLATFRDRHPYWHVYPSVFNARTNVLVSIDMVAHGGWSPWGM